MKIKKNNLGFSLVEMVIIVAIIAVIGGFAFTGIVILSSKPVDECAKKIQVAIEGNRNTTMGKLSASISFYRDSEGAVCVEENISGATPEVRQIGESGVDVSYIDASGNITSLPSFPNKVTLSFDRASGSLKPQADGSYIVQFVVSRGTAGDRGYRKLTVGVDKLTGRVTVE